jgi:hypothetical protein
MRLTFGTVGLAAACLLAVGGGLTAGARAEGPIAFEDVVYLSCAEVAEAASDDEARIVEMVTVLAAFSLERRGLVVPEEREALGLQFGELIKAFCTAEPDGLLYNAVHRAMQRLL